MALGLEVAFAGDHIFFPASHLSRIGATFDGTLAAAAIRDADPAATPPEIRTLSGETLFIPAVQRAGMERFCRAHQIPARNRPDIWGYLLEPFLGPQPRLEAWALARLHQAGLSTAEIDQIRAKVGPLMTAYNLFHGEWAHLGLANLLDALTMDPLPKLLRAFRFEEIRAELGETASFYAWAMRIANRADPQPAI
jgi:hypothetical protein